MTLKIGKRPRMSFFQLAKLTFAPGIDEISVYRMEQTKWLKRFATKMRLIKFGINAKI